MWLCRVPIMQNIALSRGERKSRKYPLDVPSGVFEAKTSLPVNRYRGSMVDPDGIAPTMCNKSKNCHVGLESIR